MFCAHVGGIRPDNCTTIVLFGASRNSYFHNAAQESNEMNGEFSTRYPVKFSTPEYHFHGLTGGEVNFIAISSDGGGAECERKTADVYFFHLFFRGDFFAAVLQTRGECPPLRSHVRVSARYTGCVSNLDRF